MTYRATIRHHSISRARTIDAGETLTAAKRAATREFRGEMIDYVIVILGNETPANPSGIVAQKRVGDSRWASVE